MDEIAADGVELPVIMGGQDWRVAWHPPAGSPPGTPHGAAAICLSNNALVLVSSDGEHWDLPGGRPEPKESLIDTLRREMREEACAVLTSCKLLGFSRGRCVRGPNRAWFLCDRCGGQTRSLKCDCRSSRLRIGDSCLSRRLSAS